MKQIETREQREKALEWMIQTAKELEHPLITEEEKAKKMKVYNYVSGQVQAFNKTLYAGSEFPSDKPTEKKPEPVAEKQPEPPKQDLSGWLD
jgi:hypothetical protein